MILSLWIPVTCSTHERTSPTHTCLEFKTLKFLKDVLGIHVFAEGQVFPISYPWPCKDLRCFQRGLSVQKTVEVFSQHRNISVLWTFKSFNLKEDKFDFISIFFKPISLQQLNDRGKNFPGVGELRVVDVWAKPYERKLHLAVKENSWKEAMSTESGSLELQSCGEGGRLWGQRLNSHSSHLCIELTSYDSRLNKQTF